MSDDSANPVDSADSDDVGTQQPVSEELIPAEVLSPIPGRPLDPPPKPMPPALMALENRSSWGKVLRHTLTRFNAAHSTLISAGTAYYAFVAMFSLLALVYGVAALLNADAIADWLTDALQEALPGLVGSDGVDPEALAKTGQTASLVGLGVLLVSGSAVMSALSNSLHTIYGSPLDGRNVIRRRILLLGWLVLLGALLLLSYGLTTAASAFGDDILDHFGLDSSLVRALMLLGVWLLAYALDAVFLALLLANLGGVRPNRKSLLPGVLLGALVLAVLKELMGTIVAWSVDKPQYGSLAIPVGILLVFWLQSFAVYGSAALVAGIAETEELHTYPGPHKNAGVQTDPGMQTDPGRQTDPGMQNPSA